MRKWMMKALAQRAIGAMPFSRAINGWLQEHVTRSVCLSRQTFEEHLQRDRLHYAALCEHRPDAEAFDALEIGTGWHPILPIALFLFGARSITTVDISPHLSASRVGDTLAEFVAAIEDGRLGRLLPEARPECVARLRELTRGVDPMRALEQMGVRVVIARNQIPALPNESIDFVVSNVALEYLDRTELQAMVSEFARVLRDDGCMSHDICMMDQYHAFDPTLSRLNFLRYSPRVWKLINNPLIPLSRLRSPDYERAFRQGGFAVSLRHVTTVSDAELDAVPLAQAFRSYSRDELRVLRANFVSHGKSSVEKPCASSTAKAVQAASFCGGLVLHAAARLGVAVEEARLDGFALLASAV
jgi:SAM-dependent methyltransferase